MTQFLIGIWIVNSLMITLLLVKAVRGIDVTIDQKEEDL